MCLYLFCFFLRIIQKETKLCSGDWIDVKTLVALRCLDEEKRNLLQICLMLRFLPKTQMVTEDVDTEDLFTLVNDFIVADRMS